MDPAVLTRSHRKRKNPFGNEFVMRENESRAGEALEFFSCLPLDKDLTSKFVRRCPRLVPRGNLDLNQTFSGPGRGRDNLSWNQCDSTFSSVDISSQMVQPGSVGPSIFEGRGFPDVSNAQSSSWNAFGLMPAMPNASLDTHHPTGLQRVLRPPMNSSLNMGIPRRRCRDFEEREFCLRGNMCPMEHGVDLIVVEDVQSLPQFNLPVTTPSAQLLAPSGVSGPLTSAVPPSTSLMNNNGIHSKICRPGMAGDAIDLNGAYTSSTGASRADLYDPDQPLWNSNVPEASAALSGLHSPKIDQMEPLHKDDISDRHHGRLSDSADNELPVSSGESQGTKFSVWDRIGSSRSRIDTKIKTDLTLSDYLENEEEEEEAFPSSQGTSFQVNLVNRKPTQKALHTRNSRKPNRKAHKSRANRTRNIRIREPPQKALRTLYVNGIPQKSNKLEALLSHFRKFGQVIDISINSGGAFVQFSRRKEAEAAMKSPDAVMGNHLIKLCWAKHDRIPDDPVSLCDLKASVIQEKIIFNKLVRNATWCILHGVDVPSFHTLKPGSMNGPTPPPPLQKKLETLEQMKEELRKKQEMLEQKRNDFRRKLDKLQKQCSGVKGDLLTEQATKRQKVGIVADPAKPSISGPSKSGAFVATSCTVGMMDKNGSTEKVKSHSLKSNTTMAMQESTSSKQQSRPLPPIMNPTEINKYNLDNPSTAFRITPPLPSGFADVVIINFDASFKSQKNCGSGGGLARNSSGFPLAAFAVPFPSVSSALEAEAMACRFAISCARKLRFTNVVFVGDNASVIEMMNSFAVYESPIASIIHDAKQLLGSFHLCHFCHVYRDFNSKAHNMAQTGLRLSDSHIWVDDLPKWLHN